MRAPAHRLFDVLSTVGRRTLRRAGPTLPLLAALLVLGWGIANAQPPQEELPDPAPQLAAPLDTPPADGAGVEEVPGADVLPLELVEFRELPLAEAMRLLSDQSGLKIVPSAAAGKVSVTLYLRDVDAMVALDALTKANGLFYKQDRGSGIIRIYTTDEYEANLGNFREEQTEVFTLLYPNPIDVAIAIQGLFGTRVSMNIGNANFGDFYTQQDLQQRFSRFNLINAFNQGFGNNGGQFGQGAAGGIGGGFGAGGGLGGIGGGLGGVGGGFGGNNFGGGFNGGGFGGGGFGMGGLGGGGGNQFQQQQLTPEAPIENLTAEQIQQLEAARANASSEDSRRAIDDLLRSQQARIYVTVIRRNNQVVIRTGDEQIMQRIRELIASLDVPTPLVLLEVKVMSLDLGDQFTSVFDYEFTDGSTTAGSFTNGLILPPTADDLSKADRRSSVTNPAGIGFPKNVLDGSSRDLTFQFVNSQFRARMQLLENNNRITNLATPLLLTANNEVSRIFIGETVPITSGFTANQVIAGGLNNTTVTGVPQVALEDIGQSLIITPNINADRTVTLRIAQENSRVNPDGGQIPVPSATGGAPSNILVDTVLRNTVSGTVVAKDGLAVAIGGLIDERLEDSRSEVPIIGKIPLLGFFFRAQRSFRGRTELVVMIRPYVFNTPAESAAISASLLEEVSIHPNSPNGIGTLNSFVPPEVLRANPPLNKLQQIFRFHSLVPKTY